MSVEDPREELEEILARCKNGRLPRKAKDWASGARDSAEDIIETIESMQANGKDAPTYSQEEALENIYKGACKWLGRNQ